jgi:signal transduction histidine kinase
MSKESDFLERRIDFLGKGLKNFDLPNFSNMGSNGVPTRRGKMLTCLISNDEKLRTLMYEIVGPNFCASPPDEEPPAADVYLWDIETGFNWPEASTFNRGMHLFVVDRQQVSAVAERLGSHAACILLKPASRATLEACLGNADVQALLADRDALLQHAFRVNLKLQEYDQDRTNFLARALHDLRSPLAAFHGYCGLLADGELGDNNAQQTELLQRMRGSTKRMIRLVEDMFELAIAGRVERKLHLEQGDIEECLNQSLHDISPLLQEKQISIAAQLEPPEQVMFMESQQIEQLLVNLLDNARRFTPRQGTIAIRGYSVHWDPLQPELGDPALAANAYRLDIRDSGPGIDASMLHSLFEEYTSYSGPNDRSGGGLGLAICKLIVNAHGGKIWAASSTDGALFCVILPFEPRIGVVRPGPKRESGGLDAVRAG